MIELAEEALALKGMQLKYTTLPWERAVIKARKGEIDCVVGVVKDNVPDFLFGEEEYAQNEMHFFVRVEDSWRFQSTESLHGRRVGAISGYVYGESVDSWITENGFVLTGNNALKRNIKMLRARRIDTIIDSWLVMSANLRNLGLSEHIISAGKVKPSQRLYFACSPNSPKSSMIVKSLDDGIRVLRRQGRVQYIMSRYGFNDWKPEAD